MRYLAAVEPFYSSTKIDATLLGVLMFVGFFGIVFTLAGAIFFFQARSNRRGPGALMFIFGAVAAMVGIMPTVAHLNSYETDRVRFIAWADETYGIKLQSDFILASLENGGLPQDDGTILVQKRTDDGGILLYQEVPPEETRSTTTPIPPLPEKSN